MLLVTAFGFGIWKSADRSRVLRVAAALIIAYGSLGILWPFAPMHLREALAAGGGTPSDSMYIVLGSVTVLLMLLAIELGVAAFGRWFCLYCIARMVVLFAFGALTFLDALRAGANLPTPWLGGLGAHQHRRVPALGHSAGLCSVTPPAQARCAYEQSLSSEISGTNSFLAPRR